MGFGALLAALLTPSEIADSDAVQILRREVERYGGTLLNEMSGVKLMSKEDREALGPLYEQRASAVDEAIRNTRMLYQLFVSSNETRDILKVDRVTEGNPPSMGYCNMHDLLIQLVRDWGEGNSNVRETHHDIILAAVSKAVESIREQIEKGQYATGSHTAHFKEGLRVLTPGDALCRLSYDLSCSGLFKEVEANEGSPLFAEIGAFIVNRVEKPFVVNPHAGVWYNQDSVAGMFRRVAVPTPFPDPSAAKAETLKLTVGGFESLYCQNGSRFRLFDVVVTSFFLDTIPGSITKALTTISNLLPIGGIWVNYGPLLYRGDEYPKLSWEEIVALLPSRGLEVVRDEHVLHAQYCERTESSLHPTIYNPRLLVARKVR